MSQDNAHGGPATGVGSDTHSDDEKTTTIIINATPYEVAGEEISYDQVVNLAYSNSPPTGEYIAITVTYSRGEHGKEGSMVKGGEPVKLKSKMVFDVSATDRS